MYQDSGSLYPDNGSQSRFQSVDDLLAEMVGTPAEELVGLNAVTTPENPLELWFTKAHVIADLKRSIEMIERRRGLEPEDVPITDQHGTVVSEMTRRQHFDLLVRQRRQLLKALEAYPDQVVFGICYFVSEAEIRHNA